MRAASALRRPANKKKAVIADRGRGNGSYTRLHLVDGAAHPIGFGDFLRASPSAQGVWVGVLLQQHVHVCVCDSHTHDVAKRGHASASLTGLIRATICSHSLPGMTHESPFVFSCATQQRCQSWGRLRSGTGACPGVPRSSSESEAWPPSSPPRLRGRSDCPCTKRRKSPVCARVWQGRERGAFRDTRPHQRTSRRSWSSNARWCAVYCGGTLRPKLSLAIVIHVVMTCAAWCSAVALR